MAVMLKCKMCGGDLVLTEGSTIATCEYCGTTQTVPTMDNEKKLVQFERAERLRKNCEFDKAAGVYESIVADFRQEAEAYWGLVLCKYGIEYVDDPATGKKVPTCHRSSFESVLEDGNFELTMENADAVSLQVYRQEAKQIEAIRKGIIEVSNKEAPYDIFICYKETDAKGDRTVDSLIAQDIYDALTEKGYRVFFSRITLEDKLGVAYEPYIFAALNSAKVMLAVGTAYEHYNAVWVKNEWSRYLKLMEKDKNKHLIPCFKDIDAYDIPKEFKHLQAQDMGKVGAMPDLLRGIDKLIAAKPADAPAVGVQTDDVNRLYIYNSALEAMEKKNPAKIREAIKKLQSMGDWKDAKEKLAEAEVKLKKAKTAKTITILGILGAIAAVITIVFFAWQYKNDLYYYNLAVNSENNYDYEYAIQYYGYVPGFKDADERLAVMQQEWAEQQEALLTLVEGDEADALYQVMYYIEDTGANFSISLNGYTVSANISSYPMDGNMEEVLAFFGNEIGYGVYARYDSQAQEYFFVQTASSEQAAKILYRGILNEDGSISVYNDAGQSYELIPSAYYKNNNLVKQMNVQENGNAGVGITGVEVVGIDGWMGFTQKYCGYYYNENGDKIMEIGSTNASNACYVSLPETGFSGECAYEHTEEQLCIDLSEHGFVGMLVLVPLGDAEYQITAEDPSLAWLNGTYTFESNMLAFEMVGGIEGITYLEPGSAEYVGEVTLMP